VTARVVGSGALLGSDPGASKDRQGERKKRSEAPKLLLGRQRSWLPEQCADVIPAFARGIETVLNDLAGCFRQPAVANPRPFLLSDLRMLKEC